LKIRLTLLLCILLFSLLGTGDGLAQEAMEEISLTAETMTSLFDGTIVAEGDVRVYGKGVNVRADKLKYDPGSKVLVLSGNVVMREEGGGSFTGEALALDLSDLTGGISRGEIIIVPNGFRVRGEDINRLGPEEYSIRKGVFTSCPGDCPDWSFTASRIQVRKEGYLEARHAAFRIVGIPVFYTPYLFYPVKTDRQSGLLFPEFSYSDETGFESRWPLFITMGPHADATVSPRTFSRDSVGLDLEARYRLDWGGGGQFRGFAMTGDRPERWDFSGEHSMALTPDIWIRGRWYDVGDETVPSLFGSGFEERYPGAVYRHGTVEGDHGIVSYSLQTSSLLTDGAKARSDTPGITLEEDAGVLSLGPGGGDLWRAAVQAEFAGFENGQSRTLVIPSLALRIPGPWKMSGSLEGRGLIGTGGEGSLEDEAYILSAVERVALESSGRWGRHRLGLQVTASAAQGAAFSESVLRDARDLVQDRKILDARLTSHWTLSGLRWDLTAGSWQDQELDVLLNYGITRVSYSGFYLKASRNQDADFGLVLPSVAVDADSLKGWQAEAGYTSRELAVAVARDSAEGFPEMLRGEGHFVLRGVRVESRTIYDLDAESVADERVTMKIPGRCWTVGIGRSRSPGRTDWSLTLELGI